MGSGVRGVSRVRTLLEVAGCHSHAHHGALLYRDPSEYVEGVGGFLRDGLREGDLVLVAVSPERRRWLREELGGDAAAVDFVGGDEPYRRLGPVFHALVDRLERRRAAGDGRVRIVNELALAPAPSGHASAYARHHMRYEAASNYIYERFGTVALCPYDAERLPDAVLEDAVRTHPLLLRGAHDRRNERFVDPRAFLRERVLAPAALADADGWPIEKIGDIAAVRAHALARASAAGLAGRALEDLELAVSEVATNAFLHGRPPRRLWTYVAEGHVVCRVRSDGAQAGDPLGPYLPPDPRDFGGRGLWLAHQLCDVVEVAGAGEVTDVLLLVRLPAP